MCVKKRAFYLLFGVLLLLVLGAAVLLGMQCKQSYVDDTDADAYLHQRSLPLYWYVYPYDAKYDQYGDGTPPADFAELEQSADAVVRVRLQEKGRREIYEECILSRVRVLESWRGTPQKGDIISVFEPVNCTGVKGELISWEGYMPMQQGEEYLLFLKQRHSARFASDDFVYLPSTIEYSKYALNETVAASLPQEALENGRFTYDQLQDREVLLYDPRAIKRFRGFKEKALQLVQGEGTNR